MKMKISSQRLDIASLKDERNSLALQFLYQIIWLYFPNSEDTVKRLFGLLLPMHIPEKHLLQPILTAKYIRINRIADHIVASDRIRSLASLENINKIILTISIIIEKYIANKNRNNFYK